MSLHQAAPARKRPPVENLGKLPPPNRVRWTSCHEIGRWHEVDADEVWVHVMDALYIGFVAVRSDDLTGITLMPAPTEARTWGRG